MQDVRQCAANFTSVNFKKFPQQYCEVHDSISISKVGKLRFGVRATTTWCKWHTLETQLPDLASGAQVGFQPSLAPQLLATCLAVHGGPAQKSQETYPRSQFRNRGLTDSEVYVPALLTNYLLVNV